LWLRTDDSHSREEVMDMIMGEQAEEVLSLALDDAKELEQLARRFREQKLTREQFTAAVEEISTKLRQAIVALLVDKEEIPFEDISPEDIPF
jgi:hypothetical protein